MSKRKAKKRQTRREAPQQRTWQDALNERMVKVDPFRVDVSIANTDTVGTLMCNGASMGLNFPDDREPLDANGHLNLSVDEIHDNATAIIKLQFEREGAAPFELILNRKSLKAMQNVLDQAEPALKRRTKRLVKSRQRVETRDKPVYAPLPGTVQVH